MQTSIRMAVRLVASVVVAMAVIAAMAGSASAAEPTGAGTPAQGGFTAAPAVQVEPCFTWTGFGICYTYSTQELRDAEALGLFSAAVSAAFVGEWACNGVPNGAAKAACKAGVAAVFAKHPIQARQAIQQNRCLRVKASLNPVGNLIDVPEIVNCRP